MASNDLDDLFRQQLDGHASPPGPGLQQRLAELAEAERLDTLFRTGLGSHASQPRRALWERLEDEHLHPQPRRRRVVAWWQYSAAAVVLLLLLAGGAGLWRGQLGQLGQLAGPVATTPTQPAERATAPQPSAPSRQGLPSSTPEVQIIDSKDIANNAASAPKKNQKNIFRQATAPALSPSNNPIATTTRPSRPATAPQVAGSLPKPTRRPDAAAGQLATTRGRKTLRNQPLATSQEASATIGAPATRDNAALAVAAFTAATAPAGVIEVDVRRGPETARPAAAPAAAVVAEAAPRRRPRLRLGGLLRQADHLVHGESVSLAEATGLPETLTLHARLGGRTLSKTIDL